MYTLLTIPQKSAEATAVTTDDDDKEGESIDDSSEGEDNDDNDLPVPQAASWGEEGRKEIYVFG